MFLSCQISLKAFLLYHFTYYFTGNLLLAMKNEEPSRPPLPIHHLTKHHRRRRAEKRRRNRRRNYRRRIHAAVLLPVHNHIHRNQLQ